MPNPLANFVEQLMSGPKIRRGWEGLRHTIVGLAHDYWKDGNWERAAAPAANNLKINCDFPKVSVEPPVERDPIISSMGLWHAQPGEISEKMWGQGCVTPGDKHVTDLLIKPLGLTKEMSVFDLSAGLGGRLRQITEKFGVYVTGLEPDPDIAKRGMELSAAAGLGKHAAIEAYDPMSLTTPRLYDCIIARETIYRVPDKEKFIKSIIACCKSKAQVSFTDYIVNSESRDHPAMIAWRAFEQGADPIGLVEMAEIWARAGISIRLHDDQTDYYKKEVKAGLVKFAKFMASGVRPDAETKRAIEKRITVWAHRIAALENGMKFYRFYGLRS